MKLTKILINNSIKAIVRKNEIDVYEELFDKVEEIPADEEVVLSQRAWVFYPYDNEFGNLKVSVEIDNIHIFTAEGFKTSLDKMPEKKVIEPKEFDEDAEPEEEKTDEDIIDAMESNREVVDYVKEKTGKEINPRGRLEYVKKNALEVLNVRDSKAGNN